MSASGPGAGDPAAPATAVPVAFEGVVADEPFAHPVLERTDRFAGRVISVVTERVDVAGHVVSRDVVRHPGAAAIVAVDDDGRVLLVRQYRHPMQRLMWEVPAGLLEPGEDPIDCARRELLEEGGAEAGEITPLLRLVPSPGGCDEVVHVFLARGVRPAPGGRVLTGEAEEADMPQAWLDLSEAVSAVLAGQVTNATTVSALLAVHALEG